MADTFSSTDSCRTARPLRHAQVARFDAPLALELGGELPSLEITYETYGQLNEARSNAVLVCHALSGDSHVASHDEEDDPGWWEGLIGPGRPVDTDAYFVICPNVLGGCRGTTGPGSTNPATGKPFGPDFPDLTIGDLATAHTKLLDHLGIDTLAAAIGGSLGGHQVLALATQHPGRLRLAVTIAASPRLTSQALAFDVVARNAIVRDPAFHEGRYYDKPTRPDIGLAIARMLGHITYLSSEAMAAKFEVDRHNPRDIDTSFEKKFSVGSYLAHQGHRFVERFDANSYVTLSLAMDRFDLGRTHEQRVESLRSAQCQWLVVSVSSDWLFAPSQSRDIVGALTVRDQPVTYCEITSPNGHDAFLLDDEIGRYGQLVQAKLNQVTCCGTCQGGGADGHCRTEPAIATDDVDAEQAMDPTSIFHGDRVDYQAILELIAPGASVLDIGCGQGGLLAALRDRGHERLVGVEVEEASIIATVCRGLNVIDYDLNEGLPAFTDLQFDYVVLSQTLQAVANVERIVDDMVRVGKRAIVSFPNFAHAPLRRMLAEEGRSPRAEGQYAYEWYNTPNRRFPSISDMQDFCEQKGLTIEDAVYLDTEAGRLIPADGEPNLNADTAIYVLSR